jgi:hypothetical protein
VKFIILEVFILAHGSVLSGRKLDWTSCSITGMCWVELLIMWKCVDGAAGRGVMVRMLEM